MNRELKQWVEWARPWPVGFKKDHTVQPLLISMTALKSMKVWIRKDERGRYLTVKTAHKKIVEDNKSFDEPGHTRHHIVSLAKFGHPDHRPVIWTVSKGGQAIIVDGNHTAMALIEKGYTGRILQLHTTRLIR